MPKVVAKDKRENGQHSSHHHDSITPMASGTPPPMPWHGITLMHTLHHHPETEMQPEGMERACESDWMEQFSVIAHNCLRLHQMVQDENPAT